MGVSTITESLEMVYQVKQDLMILLPILYLVVQLLGFLYMITFELFNWIDELFRSRSLIKKLIAACVVVALLPAFVMFFMIGIFIAILCC